MAAGLGFKDFTTGEVLTAADVDGYLMQGIWVFASAAARDAAVTSPQEGNACYLKDTNQVLTYSGSAWVAVGGGSPLTTKGDLYTFSTVDARLGVGANGTTLVADSSEAVGLRWAAPAGGGVDWVAWTPTYGNLTIGNGTVTSVKAQDGEMGYFFWRFVLGSTSSISTGPFIDLPYTNLYNNTTFYGSIRDASAGVFYTLIGSTGSADDNLYLATEKSDGTYVTITDLTSAIPVTFATGDILVITGAYPV